jgi:hypothetical protein
MFQAGMTAVFVGYKVSLGGDIPIFRPGDFVIIGRVDRSGDSMSCYPANELGCLLSLHGDTLFPEELVPLRYMPLVDVEDPIRLCAPSRS